MTEGERLIDQLERAFRGDPWFGDPVRSVLEGVDVAAALAHPVPGAHSIWELVVHMTGWKREVRARLAGAKAGEPPDGDWPALPGTDATAWRRSLDALTSAHDELIAAIRRCQDSELDAPVWDERQPQLGTGLTQWQTLNGILQHDVYHLGQIALLKKAVGSR